MSTVFPLRESVIEIRGMKCTVRELTQKRKQEVSKAIMEDRFRGPALWASSGCIDPVFTEEQAADESAEIIDQLARETMRLSGIDLGEKAAEDQPTKS